MQERFREIKSKILAELNQAKNTQALAAFRAKYLVRKGLLAKLFDKVRALPDKERPLAGKLANEIKQTVLAEFAKKEAHLARPGEKIAPLDVTAPGEIVREGHLHPITRLRYELEDIFQNLGFEIFDTTEAVSDYYNFTALNIPAGHPARDMWDTIYLENARNNKNSKIPTLLRPHTSAVQVPYMESHKPPFKAVVPGGRCFRFEATDASHECVMFQIEGFMVDHNVSVANMKAFLGEMLSSILGRRVKTRLRTSFYPFVEPGFEIDIDCAICRGRGCPACHQTGWVELLGCGLIHPKVLQYAKIDPAKWNGFAFGLGLDRLVMMRYGIEHIRHFHSGDLRFLEQF